MKENNKKLKFLLSEDIPEGFINRQLNDSRYISKVVKGLLSNVVRQDGEQEVTSRNLVTLAGSITSKLKKDWGLEAIWDDLIAPRFERMNELTKTTDFRKEVEDGHGNQYFINTVPDELKKGFNKKRIDHRHHALDALVVASVTKDHINYITSLNTQRNNFSLVTKLRVTEEKTITDKKTGEIKTKKFAKAYHKPWFNFTKDAFDILSKTIVSFKQNQRIINKTNNKTWRWEKVDGQMKKVLKKQKKINWAIRKPMHKKTVYGKVNIPVPKGKIATAVRVSLNEITNHKRLEAITDLSIQNILKNHLKNNLDLKGVEQFDKAFSQDGIIEMNNNIQTLNDGKPHQPIYKVRLYEVGVKFQVGYSGNNSSKYVEAEKGTNLFFNIYWDEKKQKRNYHTVPLNEVIEHQKQVSNLPKKERTEVPIDNKNGKFLFSLSPNDLVFTHTDEEADNPNLVDFDNLSNEQVKRVYKMEKTSGKECYFIRYDIATLVKQYDAKTKLGELGSQNKLISTMDLEAFKIVDRCWKLQVDRLGNITKILK